MFFIVSYIFTHVLHTILVLNSVNYYKTLIRMNISTCLRRSKKIVYTIWLYSMSRSMFCTKAKIFYAFSQRIVSTVEIGNFVFLLQLVRLFIKMYQFRAHTQTHPAIYYCLWRCIAFNANDKHAYCSARIKLSEKKKKENGNTFSQRNININFVCILFFN